VGVSASKYLVMIGCEMSERWSTSGEGDGLKLCIVFIAIITFISFNFPVMLNAQESSCVTCHTSTKKLLDVLRALEASKPKVEKSAESAGEG